MRGISALSASRSISSARRPRFCSVAESMRDRGRSLKKVGSQYSGRPTGAEGSSGGFDARVGGEGALARSAKIDDRQRVIAPEFDSGPGKLFGRRSEERRVGKDGVSTCRSRMSNDPSKKKTYWFHFIHTH